jgi:hypothetical protein
VAFARPGKPPGKRFSRQNEAAPAAPIPSISGRLATAF